MKAFFTLVIIVLPITLSAQTVIFTEEFGAAPYAFQLNTTDMGSVVTGDNTWVVNNAYAGGSGSIVCLGFPFVFTIPNTPSQPAAIPMANGNYMHIASIPGINSGISNCSFVAADGLCAMSANHFTRMSSDVNTVGAGTVTLSFWWICAGGASSYGEVYYSTNSGATWNLVSSPIAQYSGQSGWVEQAVSSPQFGGQPTLRFGFRFVNNTTLNTQDPAFGLDHIRISTNATAANSIVTGTVSPLSYCQGASLNVPYTANGTYAVGNVFTVERSDAAGSFASPTAIGSSNSSVSGSIACTIPPGTPVGAGYLVRVVSSDPLIVGTPFALPISVSAAPFAGNDGSVVLCKNSGMYDLFLELGGSPSNCGTWAGPTGALPNGMFNTVSDIAGVYTYTTNCPGSCPQDNAQLTVTLQNPANAGNNVTTQLCTANPPSSLLPYVSGGELTGLFFYQGQTSPLPNLTITGMYELQYVVYGTSPCPNDSSTMVFVVNAAPDAGLPSTVTLCTNEPPVALTSLLNGTPDNGGVWSDPNGNVSNGIVLPSTAIAGLYTYTVHGTAPCTNDEAFLSLQLDPCTGVLEFQNSTPNVTWAGQAGRMHTITFQGVLSDMVIHDATGRVIWQRNGMNASGRSLLDLSDRSTGAYFVRAKISGVTELVRILHQAD